MTRGASGAAMNVRDALLVDTTNITNKDNRSRPKPGDPCHTLTGKSHAPLAILDTYNQTARPDGSSHTLMSRGDTPGGNTHLVPVIAIRESGMGWWQRDDVSGTIDAHVGQSGTGALRPAVLFQADSVACMTVKDYGADVMRDVAPTLRAMNSVGGHANGGGQLGVVMRTQEDLRACDALESSAPPQAFKPSHFTRGKDGAPQDVAPACLANTDRGDNDTLIHDRLVIRRLTPRECERLQGFPDDWTLVPFGKKGKLARDSKRYKAIGNSMSTNVMGWIGERIQAVDSLVQRDRK